MKRHFITLILLALFSCTDKVNQHNKGFDLKGAWVLRHVEYPSGMEHDYSLEGDGTFCLVYDSNSMLYECRLATTTSGLVIVPTTKSVVTLVDKGGGECLYLEDGDPHPLSMGDSTITIQRNGVLFTWVRNDNIYNEWGADIRDIIANEMENTEAVNNKYVLSARERRLSNYINWLIIGIGLVVIFTAMNCIVNRRQRRQLQLQLQQIQEVQENRPQAVRQIVATVESNFFASDEYAALQKRIASGQYMKEQDWQQVEQHLKTIYPGFTSQLRSLYPMSEQEYHTCLLIKLRIAPKDIAAVLARDVSTISTIRNRLYKKVFGKKGGAKEWDDFILSIGA